MDILFTIKIFFLNHGHHSCYDSNERRSGRSQPFLFPSSIVQLHTNPGSSTTEGRTLCQCKINTGFYANHLCNGDITVFHWAINMCCAFDDIKSRHKVIHEMGVWRLEKRKLLKNKLLLLSRFQGIRLQEIRFPLVDDANYTRNCKGC